MNRSMSRSYHRVLLDSVWKASFTPYQETASPTTWAMSAIRVMYAASTKKGGRVPYVVRMGSPATSSSAPTSARKAARRSASATIAGRSSSCRQSGASLPAMNALTTDRLRAASSRRKEAALPKARRAESMSPGGKVSSRPVIPASASESITRSQKGRGWSRAQSRRASAESSPQKSGW